MVVLVLAAARVSVTCSAITWMRHDKKIIHLFNTRLLKYGRFLQQDAQYVLPVTSNTGNQ
jgi:hypothetical protein